MLRSEYRHFYLQEVFLTAVVFELHIDAQRGRPFTVTLLIVATIRAPVGSSTIRYSIMQFHVEQNAMLTSHDI
jgi:hypothetical protein